MRDCPYRVLYAFDPRRTAILLIGGDKTGNDRRARPTTLRIHPKTQLPKPSIAICHVRHYAVNGIYQVIYKQ